MAVFPESKSRKPQYGYDTTPDESVKRTSPEAGNSFIRDSWGAIRFVAKMEFVLKDSDARVLWAFYETNRLIGFTMFDFNPEQVTAQFIGTATGSAQTMLFLAKETSGHLIYKNGVLMPGPYTTTVNGQIAYGVGPQGEDQVTFAAGVLTSGQVITATYVGRKRYTVEFAEKATKRAIGHNKFHIYFSVRQKFPLG